MLLKARMNNQTLINFKKSILNILHMNILNIYLGLYALTQIIYVCIFVFQFLEDTKVSAYITGLLDF